MHVCTWKKDFIAYLKLASLPMRYMPLPCQLMGNLSCPILPVFGDISFPPSNLHGYNDFGIKYDEQNAEHLVAEIKENYKISED